MAMRLSSEEATETVKKVFCICRENSQYFTFKKGKYFLTIYDISVHCVSLVPHWAGAPGREDLNVGLVQKHCKVPNDSFINFF